MTTDTKAATQDAAYAAAQALHDIATVIGRDLLPAPLGIDPPWLTDPMSVHVRAVDAAAWHRSMRDLTRHASMTGFHNDRGTLDGTDTVIRLTWIDPKATS